MTKLATLAGTILAAIIACLTLWGTYGWITRQAYAVDEQAEVEVHQGQATQASIDALSMQIGTLIEKVDTNQTEWKCDEATEAAVELQIDIEDEQDRRERYKLKAQLTAIVNNMATWNCAQFEN